MGRVWGNHSTTSAGEPRRTFNVAHIKPAYFSQAADERARCTDAKSPIRLPCPVAACLPLPRFRRKAIQHSINLACRNLISKKPLGLFGLAAEDDDYFDARIDRSPNRSCVCLSAVCAADRSEASAAALGLISLTRIWPVWRRSQSIPQSITTGLSPHLHSVHISPS